MFLNTPSWSSDRDPQRRLKSVLFRVVVVNSDLKPLTLSVNSTIYVFKRFGPLNLLTFLGGRAASSGQLDVPVGFFYTSEPNTYRRL